MAKLVTKFKYLKPNDKLDIGGYAKYIATRESVEKIDDTQSLAPATIKQKKFIEKLLIDFPDTTQMIEYEDYLNTNTIASASELISRAIEDNAYSVINTKTYADYIATRPRAERFGSHGLFTDDGVRVSLSQISEQLNLHEGNVWTMIVSLRREDAERLGFNSATRWRDMLRTQTETLATNLKIPMDNLKWFAAYHNESHHPHIHLIAYSDIVNEGFLTKQGVQNIRSSLAKDIFAQDNIALYQKQTKYRDTLRKDSKQLIADIISQINNGEYENPKVEELLQKISVKLKNTTAKKVYGYQKSEVKDMIDCVVDELVKDKRIDKLYNLWYDQKFSVLKTYTDNLPDKIPLSKNNEFKNIRNAVIKEAMQLYDGSITFEDNDINNESIEKILVDDFLEPTVDPVELDYSNQTYTDSQSWWSSKYKQARKYLYGSKETDQDFEKALSLMFFEAENKNGYAMHDYAKMLLSGLGCNKDEDTAEQWFKKAYDAFIQAEQTAEKSDYLQYRIGKLFSFGYGVEQSYQSAAEWYEKSVSQKNPFAAYALGLLYNRGQGVEQNCYRAFSLFQMAANDEKKPNAYAMYELGKMYKDGIGTVHNKADSDKWYKSAYQAFVEIEREMSDDKLQYRLGQMNLKGIGTEVSLNTAFDYFTKSAKLENSDAHYGLGNLYLNKEFEKYDTQKAVEHLIEAANCEHNFAAYALGKLFFIGDRVDKDILYGLRWLEYSAEKNNQYAQYFIGNEYLVGTEIPKNIDTAVIYLSKSADQSNQYAQYKLGKLYLIGEDVPHDIKKAVELLSMSADQGNEQAEYLLGKAFLNGELLSKDIQKGVNLLERAANKGNQFAQYLLGKFYLTVDGALKDIHKAIWYLEKASEQGNQFAQYALGKLYLYGKEVECDVEKVITLLTASAEQGNIYATNLLKNYRHNKNVTLGMGTFRLFQHLSRILQNKIYDDRHGKAGIIDKRQRSTIDDKKMAHGLRQ